MLCLVQKILEPEVNVVLSLLQKMPQYWAEVPTRIAYHLMKFTFQATGEAQKKAQQQAAEAQASAQQAASSAQGSAQQALKELQDQFNAQLDQAPDNEQLNAQVCAAHLLVTGNHQSIM